MDPFWVSVNEPNLRQGDWIPNCLVPVFGPQFAANAGSQVLEAETFDLIVVSQSCDLEHAKARLVAVVPIFPVSAFEAANPAFTRKGRWNEVLKGRIEGLHLLASPSMLADNRQAMVVDFREIYSLPFGYLVERAKQTGPRWRLQSPFLEHFSQALARFFMRVGLPSTIPEFH